MILLPLYRILIFIHRCAWLFLSFLFATELRIAAICAMSLIVVSGNTVEANQRVSVIALVNGEPITSLDLENRMKFLRLLSNLEMDETDFRNDTLQKLVVEKIKLQAAKEQLSQYIGEASRTARQLIDRNFTRDGKAGSQILSEIGISTATVTEQYVADILWRNALRIRFPRQFENLENLAQLELERLKKAQNEPQIKLREILLQPNPKRPLDKTTELADKIVAALKKNSDFTSIASQYSEAATAARGGRVNWMLVSQLPAPFRQPLKEAETNAIIGPLEFEGRIYILKKDGFRKYGLSDPKAASLTLVRAILPLLADASREERIAATKQIAAQTANLQTCDEMADLNRNLASGALPYLKDLQIGSLSPQLQKIVTPLQVNEKTRPLPFAEGMTVFMVCDRNQPKIELPNIETLKQAEFEKLLTNISGRYLLRLQRKAVIDYRS